MDQVVIQNYLIGAVVAKIKSPMTQLWCMAGILGCAG